MAWSQSNGLHGDDVFNHDPGVLNDNTINHQLKDLLLDGKGRIDQSVLDAGAEHLQPLHQAEFLFPATTLLLDLVDPLA
jgi:hypothetical protein